MNKIFLFKRISYIFMAIIFYIAYLFPINENKILLIMTHDDSDEGNVGSTYKYFKKKNPKSGFQEGFKGRLYI